MARHHSSSASGLTLEGACQGVDRFEQLGPEQGRPGIGAQGERLPSTASFDVAILRISSELAAAAALASSTEFPGWLQPASARGESKAQAKSDVNDTIAPRNAIRLVGRKLMKFVFDPATPELKRRWERFAMTIIYRR
jgi:hypothetical protein